MSSNGRVYPIRDLLTRVEETVRIEPATEYRQVTVRVAHKGTALRGVKIGADIGSPRQYVAHAGQLILSRIDARHGAVALIPESLEGAVVTNDFWLFEVNRDLAEPEFLDALFGSDDFVEACVQASEGTTNRVRLQMERFRDLEVRLPSLAAQRAVVSLLSRTQGMMSRARELASQAALEAEQLMISLHVRASDGRMVAIRDLVTLDEIREPVVAQAEYPQVGIRAFGQGLFPRGSVTQSQTTYRAFNKLFPGALVLSQVKGWEGALAVCPAELGDRFASPEYRTFRCVDALPEYLGLIVPLKWFWSRLALATRGVGARRERTRPEQFLDLSLPFPSPEAQRRLLPALRRASLLRDQYSRMAEMTDHVLPSLVHDAFDNKHVVGSSLPGAG